MRVRRLATACLLASALALLPLRAGATVLITIDKTTQRMTVAIDGQARWTWPVSTGRAGYLTPAGAYTAFRMEAEHYSKEWDDAPMPHSIFFTREGHAIHGTYEARRLGAAVSHGCVRLSTANAAQLYALVQQEGLPNTKVLVTGHNAAPQVAQRYEADAPLSLAPPYAPRLGAAPRAIPGSYYPPGYSAPPPFPHRMFLFNAN